MNTATEMEYLEWFYQNCDFGPAHEDVVMSLQRWFEDETGKRVPRAYRYEE